MTCPIDSRVVSYLVTYFVSHVVVCLVQNLCHSVSPAERIYGITYHISSSPYYSEDIHTNYTDITLGYYSNES